MRRIGPEERRARLALRHRLAAETRVDDPVAIARDVVGLHATDPSSVHLGACARMRTPDRAAVEAALYEERTLVRMLGMRRTMFVLPLELAGVVHAACTEAIAARERRTLEGMLAGKGVADPAARLREIEERTLRALAERGEATGAELSADVPELREEFPYGTGKTWEGVQRLTTRLLALLAAEGQVVRGRPRGSWVSSQYRWAPLAAWLPGGLPAWSVEDAQAELARRWLAAFGPATLVDLRWWTGWTAREARRALERLDVAEVELDGETGLALAVDLEPVGPPEPWIALLPGLDTTVMGWKRRDWYLGPHGSALFDRAGNAGPTVWCGGRVVGGWGQRPDGEVVFRLLEDVGRHDREAVEAEAARLGAHLDGVRVSPRFRTPLERELAA